ncbi:MAG TPA: CDC27 family protein [Bacteriovoracaceae bacterium]|nr:CDC27 family protein [Bacteriovoracaceae bacterium]
MFKKNPRGRVFAPLAESYRKLGMLEDAYKILKEGIRNHPTYTLGYIVLAHCYYDEEKYELTYNTLRPIISQNADNISLQKIFAMACINMGHLEEALETFKYLLFLNPKDKFFAEHVKKLEDDLMVGHKKLNLEQLIRAPDNLPAQTIQPLTLDDDWVQVDFNQTPDGALSTPLAAAALPQSSGDDEWVMQKGPMSFETVQAPQEKIPEQVRTQARLEDHPILTNEGLIHRSLDDDFYADELEEDFGDIDEENASSIESESPIVSHTLIDLYCGQHYYEKAIELLEKILLLNPDDHASAQKLKNVKKLQLANNSHDSNSVTEQEGHDELIQLIETQVKTKSPKEARIQQAFTQFLEAIKTESQLHR